MRHPIHDLIANATAKWEEKLGRQSKTIGEAVKEYKKRYGRNPPKGFDKWFAFAQSNDVILLDEFDNIARDLLPFWAIPPSVIHERSAVLEEAPWTFTMQISKGKVEIKGAHAGDGRAADQAKLMQRWVRWVGDVNVTMSAHDGPSIMTDDGTRMKHIEAAKKGVLLSDEELDVIDEDASLWGFPLSCPPDSRLRRAYTGLETSALPIGPSFVHDHLKTMDMCENPEWQYLHGSLSSLTLIRSFLTIAFDDIGFTAWPGMRPKLIQPLFSFAKTTTYNDILLTPLEQYWDTEPWDPEWSDKPNNKAVWRGSTTGVWFDRTTWWRSSQRVRLYFMAQDKTGSQNVRFNGAGLETPLGHESIAERRIPTEVLMERYVDFGFSGKAGQCDEDDGSCDAVKRIIDFQPGLGWNQANEYKYLLDIDGNAWSGRFHRLLSSNSAVLKSSIFPEWYSDWIQPWVHYIPLKIDYTDLFDVMSFFSGDLDGSNAHDDLAKAIADQGKEYTAKFWRYQDMEAYFFRLALEWARISSRTALRSRRVTNTAKWRKAALGLEGTGESFVLPKRWRETSRVGGDSLPDCRRVLLFSFGSFGLADSQEGFGHEVQAYLRAVVMAQKLSYTLLADDTLWNYGSLREYFLPRQIHCQPPSDWFMKEAAVPLGSKRWANEDRVWFSSELASKADDWIRSETLDANAMSELQSRHFAHILPQDQTLPPELEEVFGDFAAAAKELWRPNDQLDILIRSQRMELGLGAGGLRSRKNSPAWGGARRKGDDSRRPSVEDVAEDDHDYDEAGGAERSDRGPIIGAHIRLGDRESKWKHAIETIGVHGAKDAVQRLSKSSVAQPGYSRTAPTLFPAHAEATLLVMTAEAEVTPGLEARADFTEAFIVKQTSPPPEDVLKQWKDNLDGQSILKTFDQAAFNKLPRSLRVTLTRYFIRDLTTLALYADSFLITASSNVGRLACLIAGEEAVLGPREFESGHGMGGRVRSLDSPWHPMADPAALFKD
ncbi:hypothetical protein P7C70_g4014, partial [Phenoliferia sp. Uapishka_3]